MGGMWARSGCGGGGKEVSLDTSLGLIGVEGLYYNNGVEREGE